ncbi:hypothetical protein SERLADRAFT_365896 [Serpula lacrymans var. lacrymans S7.9]|uniref:Uncharacterized protein n=1 Tax=Serpula lacrymans var. lacrymans (strain S7.9) TaxID=578457 RepID=F8NH46_SERL9|nr:uncharacterized protein SERLADRAFT_365896 [Serpula lacrymans var. lacrymans S7.9]EGO29903.1 hypothetical protein SERLADRAFT_365896 [Serpula lacrymans var. lacrymans S7.9]
MSVVLADPSLPIKTSSNHMFGCGNHTMDLTSFFRASATGEIKQGVEPFEMTLSWLCVELLPLK